MTINNINSNQRAKRIKGFVTRLLGRNNSPVRRQNELEIAAKKGKEKAQAEELELAVAKGIQKAKTQVTEAIVVTATAHQRPENNPDTMQVYVRIMTDRELGLEGGASDNSVVTTQIKNTPTQNPDDIEIHIPPENNIPILPTTGVRSRSNSFGSQGDKKIYEF